MKIVPHPGQGPMPRADGARTGTGSHFAAILEAASARALGFSESGMFGRHAASPGPRESGNNPGQVDVRLRETSETAPPSGAVTRAERGGAPDAGTAVPLQGTRVDADPVWHANVPMVPGEPAFAPAAAGFFINVQGAEAEEQFSDISACSPQDIKYMEDRSAISVAICDKDDTVMAVIGMATDCEIDNTELDRAFSRICIDFWVTRGRIIYRQRPV